jgi:hypothetical protein
MMRNPAQALGNGVQQPSQSQQQQQQQQQQQLQQRQQQQILAQSHQANTGLAGTMQTSANGLGSNLSTISGMPQNSIPNMPGQVMNPSMMNSRLQQLQQQQQAAVQQQQQQQQQQQAVQQQVSSTPTCECHSSLELYMAFFRGVDLTCGVGQDLTFLLEPHLTAEFCLTCIWMG